MTDYDFTVRLRFKAFDELIRLVLLQGQAFLIAIRSGNRLEALLRIRRSCMVAGAINDLFGKGANGFCYN